MIDVQVYLGRWPFRRLPHDEPEALAKKLRSLGITAAWAGSFDALLHEDLAAVNARLADDCARYSPGFFVPFGTINPQLPDWREDLRRCRELHRMPGIRLHPNYHGYSLDDPNCIELFAEAAAQGLIVQLAVQLEDERTQHPLVRVPPVDLTPLEGLLDRLPKLRLVLLNALLELRDERLTRALRAGNVAVEIAMLEGIGGVGRLLTQVGGDRILFSTLAPLFIPESAVLKLKESELNADQRHAITSANAQRWRA